MIIYLCIFVRCILIQEKERLIRVDIWHTWIYGTLDVK